MNSTGWLIERRYKAPNRWAALVLAFVAVTLIAIWTSMYFRHAEATSCLGASGSPRLRTITGEISSDPVQTTLFLLRSSDQKAVLSGYSRRSTFGDLLSRSIGRGAVATFCGDELLSLDIDGRRVFTQDASNETLLLFGRAFLLIFALALIVVVYGQKRINFGK